MAWIESHDDLPEHPKTKKMARLLGISIPAAIGHLHCLWYWSMKYAQDGDLAGFTCEDIADAARWDGDPDDLVSALCAARFLDQATDGFLSIHDWDGGHPSRKIGNKLRAEWESIAHRVRPVVFKKDGYKCVFCNSTDNLEVDHIIPIAQEGTNDLNNLQTLCRTCNRRKGGS